MSAHAEPVKGEASFSAAQGFARLVLTLEQDIESEVVTAGSVLVIRFKQPIDVPVDKLSEAVPDYVGSARRDPDGTAIRLALNRKVTVNSMTAGERLFIDLLPEGWKGPPPGLPQELVRELAERARVAERMLREQKTMAEVKKRPAVRVRASVQPTFVRFVFELPEGVNVSSALEEKKLSLVFAPTLTFDLSEAKLVAPSGVASIEQKTGNEFATVTFGTIGEVDVHSFRDDRNYVVDIGFDPPGKASTLSTPMLETKPAAPSTLKTHEAPQASPVPEKLGAVPPNPSESAVHDKAQLAVANSEASAPAPQPEAVRPEPKVLPATMTEARQEHPAPASERPAPESIPAPPNANAAVAPSVNAATHDDGLTVIAKYNSDGLRLTFPFKEAKSVALFRRSDYFWLVVDDLQPIVTDAIRREGSSIVSDISTQKLDKGQAIRLRLNRPQLASLATDGTALIVTLADTMQTPSLSLSALRNMSDPARAQVAVALPNPATIHKLSDSEAGDVLQVITAPLPARGLIRRQDFVEFSLLESIHGVVVQSNADDLTVNTSADAVVLSRPGGLTLSSADMASRRSSSGPRPMFDVTQWRENHDSVFNNRLDELINAVSQASGDKKIAASIDLSRFYLAQGFYPEAKGAVDVVLADTKPGSEDPAALIIHGVASILSGQPEIGLKDFNAPVLGRGYDLQAWKGLAYASQEKWPEAREIFKNAELSIAALPTGLQRVILAAAMRASLKVRDYGGAAARINDLDVVGITPELQPSIAVMRAQLAEALGRETDALSEYRDVALSSDAKSAAEARLYEIALRRKRGEISPEDALQGLETLAVTWRGDAIELETLHQLARIYEASGKYGMALAAARLATLMAPNADVSRQMQDETSELFSQLFLDNKGDGMQPIEALGLFYEYRELTPIGRRGDEMIRKLAERLVNIDLLDQAAELLQYQVDHRLEGAARAQVATRLATIYLMNRKPDRALDTLHTTRVSDLAGELRQQRMLLEARAQSDIGRHDLALDIIANLDGREVQRLRSDIHWAARRWRESAEQIELYYGDRWKDFTPLNAVEKSDIVRAAVGYALAEDAIGLGRFREKYEPKMTDPSDRAAFDLASKPIATTSVDFARIAKMAAGVDTLDGFLRDMKSRFPEKSAKMVAPADPDNTGALRAPVRERRASVLH
jgi:hypothetical protein